MKGIQLPVHPRCTGIFLASFLGLFAHTAAAQTEEFSWFDWKDGQTQDHGVTFGLYGYWLFQTASETQTGEDEAFGEIYRLPGSWAVFGRDTGHPGRLEWRVEYRSRIGSYLAPSQLAGAAGFSAMDSGFVYSPEFDLDMSVFNWTQEFNDQRGSLAIGRLAFDVHLDAFPMQTISRGFLNRVFLVNPAMAGTGIGALGAVGKGFVNDNVWLGAHIYDANAVNGQFDMDTFDQGEWLKAVEIGWTPEYSLRKTNRIQFTWWEKDAREQAGIPRGQGWTVSTGLKRGDWYPFARFGHSDGGAGVKARDAASAGFEYASNPRHTWSLGLGWINPVADHDEDETVVEASYEYQLWRGFSLLPNVQLLMDPANNSEEDKVWVLGLRGFLKL